MDKELFKQMFKELLQSGDISIYAEETFSEWEGKTKIIEVWIDGDKIYESKN